MPAKSTRIFPLGENALTIEFGNEISERLNDLVLSLVAHFDTARFPCFVEVVPAYASVTIFYDLLQVRRSYPEQADAFTAVQALVEQAIVNLPERQQTESRIVEIPVDFSIENAPDLQFVAESHSLEREDVIRIFTAAVYRVYMLGFLPGFAYMGEVDKRIVVPRKTSPRLKVPKGSVGIAGAQTGIYPLESPGGWQIIGKTDLELFTTAEKSPCLLRPGDLVKFTSGAQAPSRQ